MAKAKPGDTVKVIYFGQLEDGSLVDSSEECEEEECGCESGPLEFTLGEEELIPGLEQALIGMSPGEKKTLKISAEEAYGEHDEKMIFHLDRKDLPADLEPEIGQVLEITDDDGEDFAVIVTAVTPASITIDANHPLAGKDIIYDVELVEIV